MFKGYEVMVGGRIEKFYAGRTGTLDHFALLAGLAVHQGALADLARVELFVGEHVQHAGLVTRDREALGGAHRLRAQAACQRPMRALVEQM
mgnify:CR=1 FL=1